MNTKKECPLTLVISREKYKGNHSPEFKSTAATKLVAPGFLNRKRISQQKTGILNTYGETALNARSYGCTLEENSGRTARVRLVLLSCAQS